MRITLACVGKLKEKYLQDGVAEFTKRLTPFCKLETLSINEEKMPENPSAATKKQILDKETKRLLALIPANSYVLLLDVVGQELTSPALAEKLEKLMVTGKSHLTFVIGGAYGFTDELRHRADERLSFSQLTFTHQMIRLLLVEQLYRAFKIMRHEKYHN